MSDSLNRIKNSTGAERDAAWRDLYRDLGATPPPGIRLAYEQNAIVRQAIDTFVDWLLTQPYLDPALTKQGWTDDFIAQSRIVFDHPEGAMMISTYDGDDGGAGRLLVMYDPDGDYINAIVYEFDMYADLIARRDRDVLEIMKHN